MKKIIFASMAFMLMFFAACSSDNQIFPEEIPTVETPFDSAEDGNEGEVVVPTEQSASTIVSLEDVAKKGLGGIKLNFTMSGITKIELESVDGYQLAGNLSGDKESIITFSAPEGETLTPGKDYYIITFPCDLYGGYRLSIYKGRDVAAYFGVHQKIQIAEFITPLDLVESELEFADIDAPFVEDERPNLDALTKSMLVAYQQSPTDENKQALMEQMGVKYDKVVARKKAKLRQLEREAKTPDLVAEM